MYSAVVVDITPRAAKTRAMTFNAMCGYRLDIRK